MAEVSGESTSRMALAVEIEAPDAPNERWLEDVTNDLKQTIASTSDATVSTQRDSAPRGTHSGAGIVLGELLVDIAGAALPALISLLGDWLKARRSRVTKIKLTMGDKVFELSYDPSGISGGDLAKLVAAMTAAQR